MSAPRAVVGDDGLARCPWAQSDPLNREYHDTEWGLPIHGESAHLERLTLEAFQSGLSWLTILRKRDAFRAAFAGFEAEAVAAFDETDVERLMADEGIVRNRQKVEAAITNARATVALRETGGLEALVRSHAPAEPPEPQTLTTSPESEALAKALKKVGFRFVGPTTMFALMEATGLFDPHLHDCHRRGAVARPARVVAGAHRVHAFADDALGDLDAVGLVAAMHAGLPVTDVVEAAIERAHQVDKALGAIAHEDLDRARALARRPRPGWFAGVPTFVKDNVDVAGMPTQHGCDAFTGAPSPTDGDFARMYLATGVIPLGKSRLSEFGFSAAVDHPRLGAVRSPWHPDHYAGASSAGAAALVAAGAVPIAHANDGGGSIRIPASVNGLVGLKPTRGRLAQDVMMRQIPVRIISDGVLTRSVRDTAAFYREAEKVFRDPRLLPVGDVTRPGRKRLRIAMATTGIGRSATEEVREHTVQTATLLESLGHHVEEIEPPVPGWLADHFVLYWSMLALNTVSRGRRMFGPTWDPDRLDNLTLGLARHCRRHLARLPLAIASLSASRYAAARHHARYDVTLTPTLATPTPQVGHLDPMGDYDEVMDRLMDWVAFTPLANATGEPAVSLPLAMTEAGLPQGMMFGAGAGREALLLGLALELEEARPWARIAA